MDIWDKLRLHTDALATAVDADPKYFVSVMHYVKQLQEFVNAPNSEVTQEDFKLLVAKIENFFYGRRTISEFGYSLPLQAAEAVAIFKDIAQVVGDLGKIETSDFKTLLANHYHTANSEMQRNQTTLKASCVFIGHGRSKLWARVKMFLEDELNIPTVTYESESRVSESIVPVLEKMLDQATFAVLILTAEDETVDGELRARQNVIHEAGLFQGRLGFKKAVLLKQDGLEGFTNIEGLQYIPFSDNSIEHTFYELQRVIKREKVI